jgi:hypothetical protein
MSEAPAPAESGPLSVEQAIAAITPEPASEAAPEAPQEAAAEPVEIEAEPSPAEETEGDAESAPEGEEGAAEEEPVVALEPPPYWTKEHRAHFASMSPEDQAVVLAQEGPREEIVAKVKAEAEAVRKAADAELGKVGKLAEELSDFLPKAIEVFQSRWGADPDWVAYATEHGSDAMVIAKAQHDQELALLQRTAKATEIAQTQAQQAFVKAEFATLAEIAPELADPTTGPALRTEVTKYLIDDGIDPAAIQNISAREMRIARKAMLYDKAQAALKAKPAPKPITAPATRAPVRPGAAPAQSSSRSSLQQAQSRFNLNPSVENAEALMLAKG